MERLERPPTEWAVETLVVEITALVVCFFLAGVFLARRRWERRECAVPLVLTESFEEWGGCDVGEGVGSGEF